MAGEGPSGSAEPGVMRPALVQSPASLLRLATDGRRRRATPFAHLGGGGGAQPADGGGGSSSLEEQLLETCKDLIALLCINNDLSYEASVAGLPLSPQATPRHTAPTIAQLNRRTTTTPIRSLPAPSPPASSACAAPPRATTTAAACSTRPAPTSRR